MPVHVNEQERESNDYVYIHLHVDVLEHVGSTVPCTYMFTFIMFMSVFVIAFVSMFKFMYDSLQFITHVYNKTTNLPNRTAAL
jgi:hypothetical protein